MLPLKGVSYHEVHLTMIYYRMKYQSVGSAEFNTAYFHALWFYEVDGFGQERRNSISNALELRLSCTNHRNENTFCTRTVMCPRWLLEQPFGQTLEWPVSWDSIAYDSYISVDLHACETVLKIFSWVFPRVQPQYSPKLVNTLRPEQWWLMFGTHFRYIFLNKICSFAELVMKLVCWLTSLRHNNILPHKHYSGVTCA